MWINKENPCNAATGSGSPQSVGAITAWLKNYALKGWHGFEEANFADWVLHANQNGGWSRVTDEVYHQASSGYMYAGTPGAMAQDYHMRKWNIGTLGKEVRCELWLRLQIEVIGAATRTARAFLAIGTSASPSQILVESVSQAGEGTTTKDWARFLVIFYQDDAIPYNKWAKVYRREGDSWVFQRDFDFGGVGDWSFCDHIYLRTDTYDGGKAHSWWDKLLVFKTKV